MPRKPDTPQTLLRQWDMLRLVPRYPAKITAADIARRLASAGHSVTKRTVERDIVSLSARFPLVVDDRAAPFGWSWEAKAAPLDIPHLTLTQALAFVFVEEHLGKLLPGSVAADLGAFFKMARQRLGDEATGGAGRRWTERVKVVPPTQPLIAPRVDPSVHAAVTEALLQAKQLGISYRSRDSSAARPATIHPLGLVQRGPVLYLVAVYGGYEDVRMLALHRLLRAEVLPERADCPPGFDMDRYVREGKLDFGSGKSIAFVAIFDKDAALHLAEAPLSKDQVLVQERDGGVRLEANIPDTPQLRWWLLGFAGRVEVVAPARLRQEMAGAARSMAARYSNSNR